MTVEEQVGSATYRLVVPPSWTRLPMEPVAMRAAARSWLLKRYGHAPRDRTATLRRELVSDLVGVVEVHVPVPDRGETLLLSFATPLVPLFDPLTELFVLMASSVQWQDDDGHWR